MNWHATWPYLLAAAVVLSGCSKKDEAEVLMRVGDEVLTKKSLDSQIALRMKVMGKKYAKKSESLAKLGEYEQKLRDTAALGFTKRAVFVAYAKDHKIGVDGQELSAYLNKAAGFYGYGTAAALKAAFTADEYAAFEDMARFEFMAEKGEKAFDESIVVTVSDQEIDAGFAKLNQINATAQATNALVFARATNVYERIRSGSLTFDQAVKTYSEDEALIKNGLWGTLKFSDIKAREPQLDKLLSKGAKKGDILPPIECDNAVAIIKVGPQINETVALSRVLFRLAQEWEIPAREKLREVLEYNKFTKAKAERGEALLKSYKVWGRDDKKAKKGE